LKSIESVRRSPRQTRSRETVAVILDATTRVLVQDGVDSFNTNRIAEIAGISIGSLYQYFPNKDALLLALNQRHVHQMHDIVHSAMLDARGLPLPLVITKLIHAFVLAHTIDPGLHRALTAHAWRLKTSDDADSRGQETLAQLQHLVAMNRSIVVPKNTDLAVQLMLHTVHALVHKAVIDEDSPASRAEMEAEITQIVLGYLLGSASVAEDTKYLKKEKSL
jgi:AcrR family transcriptional regulator